MKRESFEVARRTVKRLMLAMGLRDMMRGKRVGTTVPEPARPCPRGRVNRQFNAPALKRLWVNDLSCVATWQGFIHTAFVIDAYARRIVGWRLSRTATAGYVVHTPERAIHERRLVRSDRIVAHSDRGSQYLGLRYTERSEQAGLEPSVGSVGDSYENALAEIVIGLYKTEVIRPRRP